MPKYGVLWGIVIIIFRLVYLELSNLYYIRILRDKTMDDKLIYIPIDDKQNYPFCRLTLLDVKVGPTNPNSIKVPKD